MANIISVAFYPRYRHARTHMKPLVVAAMRRVLYDDMSVEMTEITAAEYERIVAPPAEEQMHDLQRYERPAP